MTTPLPPADPWPAPTATGPLHATVALPGSKSLTNRALILAALADGPSVVRRALRSRDTLLMAQALTSVGATVDTSGADWVVTPLDGSVPADHAAVDCGLAGTVMRFVPPVAGLVRGEVAFDGDPHMRNRPVGEVLTALAGLGITIDSSVGTPGALPFTIRGTGSVPGGTVVIDASASSQFVSALLLAGARFDAGVDVRHDGKPIPSLPHIEMTIAMLRDRGVAVDDSDANRWAVAPGPIAAHDEAIEPDLSNAAPFLALAAVSGGSVTVRDWPRSTTQAGDALRDLLSRMGCRVTFGDDGLTVTGPEGGARGLLGLEADLHDVGELAPAIAALCALASTPSHLTGIAHIRGHETDRLAALATELGALGAAVVEHPDGLSIKPAPLSPGVFHTYADHRMAHAGVIIGAAVPGVLVENVATTSKTFPDFAAFWSGLF
ncbi:MULTISPECIES: 3-phosphoshikimate 1-carboxyvinyltransferase [unclassified Nocardioides]|uniref:3-phosphoshikimate 1-carboxyvinyltransferase n=1 Tax=unclassified Nocardioides TaxID=2615069 RepID=UPI0006F6A0D4|nr:MULTISPECIES: 3-phosphoshikimate 1-carboxyvinyltransferase [unclassified Nocardioides]KRA37554.1 3-phosphoshikimate 1-carboxyvinyltransferase [Nocardioides sp. Root614]KRA91515.1 3-phosphoshikimate 1-carboxyvinyltransferase [Nocardioides sp. Root682]